MKGLHWFRRDLRINDNRALAKASQECSELDGIFIFDSQILSTLPKNDRRVSYIIESIYLLQNSLKKNGIKLHIVKGTPQTILPKFCLKYKINTVYTNRDYEATAKIRDEKIFHLLKKNNIQLKDFKDHVVFEAREILNLSGSLYKVFTPYKNKWLSEFKTELIREEKMSVVKNQKKGIDLLSRKEIYKIAAFQKTKLWLQPGEEAAKESARHFFSKNIKDYKRSRDFPSLNEKCSQLSTAIRFGEISIRELLRQALKKKSEGASTWVSELIWREFYQMILDQCPHVVSGAFKKEFNAIHWPGKLKNFQKWKDGETGFPLVDAAMRHFKNTGLMHNRLRMVTASFLVKDLLIDWRLGEKYFAATLMDFDLAANNGGWQWSASTGCDAQPYFRVFNPTTQSQRFDPEGTFIKEHLPELKELNKKEIHEPYKKKDLFSKKLNYPTPIVDHSKQRLLAIQLFKDARENK